MGAMEIKELFQIKKFERWVATEQYANGEIQDGNEKHTVIIDPLAKYLSNFTFVNRLLPLRRYGSYGNQQYSPKSTFHECPKSG